MQYWVRQLQYILKTQLTGFAAYMYVVPVLVLVQLSEVIGLQKSMGQ